MAKYKIKRPVEAPGNVADHLVKNKKVLEGELKERIEIGQNLLKIAILNDGSLTKLQHQFNFWHDYNTELLKRAFDNANNQYLKEYTNSPSIRITSVGAFTRNRSLKERAEEARGNISKYVIRLEKILAKLPLIDQLADVDDDNRTDKQNEGLVFLEKIFLNFHKVAQNLRHRHNNRDTLIIKDEYDVQDLLRSLLVVHFHDIREEDYSPSYAGSNSRIDFVLKDEKIVLETKMTNDHLKDKEIGSQLLIDAGRYRGHPDCDVVVMFIYDRGDHIRNKKGLINDLENLKDIGIRLKVFIEPM